MNVRDTQEILELAEVNPAYYSLDDERHEALCLLPDGDCWLVFISERGKRREVQEFQSQDAACTLFL